jgi:hypothetical protein
MATSPEQIMLKRQRQDTYEAGKTKKGKFIVAGNVGGAGTPAFSPIIHATIAPNAGTTMAKKPPSQTGEGTASTVVKRRDYEQSMRNIVYSTQAARFRLSGK